MRTVAAAISSLVQARQNCAKSGNADWFAKHGETLGYIEKNYLPSGSGIDSGTKIDLDRSNSARIVLTFSFHHMNDVGYYDGWTKHAAIVTPDFDGISIRITGSDRNDIKDYLHDVYQSALGAEFTYPVSTSA